MIPSLEFVYAALAAQQAIEPTERKAEFTPRRRKVIMSTATNVTRSNRDHNSYDLPDLGDGETGRNLRHDGMTVNTPTTTSSPNTRGGEYQVFPDPDEPTFLINNRRRRA